MGVSVCVSVCVSEVVRAIRKNTLPHIRKFYGHSCTLPFGVCLFPPFCKHTHTHINTPSFHVIATDRGEGGRQKKETHYEHQLLGERFSFDAILPAPTDARVCSICTLFFLALNHPTPSLLPVCCRFSMKFSFPFLQGKTHHCERRVLCVVSFSVAQLLCTCMRRVRRHEEIRPSFSSRSSAIGVPR